MGQVIINKLKHSLVCIHPATTREVLDCLPASCGGNQAGKGEKMRLISIKEHPNGLKIVVASALSGRKVDVTLKTGEFAYLSRSRKCSVANVNVLFFPF